MADQRIAGSFRLVDGTSDLTYEAKIDSSGNQYVLLSPNDGVDIGDVDIASLPAPLNVTNGGLEATALRVTIANDSTGLLSVDDNGGSLTVDNAGTFAVQVDTALPAGTNAIGKLAANSGVDIGDVDVTSLPGGLEGYTDGTSVTGESGLPSMALIDNVLAGGLTDDQFTFLRVDADGKLHVTTSGSVASSDTKQAGTAADDEVDNLFPQGAIKLDTLVSLPVGIADNDYSHTYVDGKGALYVNVDSSALPTGAATSALQTTGNSSLADIKTAVEIIDNAISGTEMQVDIVSSALPTGAATETTLDAIKTAVELLDNAVSGTELQVDIVASLPAGTNAIGKLAANDGVDIGDVDVASLPGSLSGIADSDAFVAQTGLPGMALVEASLSAKTDNDFVFLRTDSDGALWVNTVDSAAPASTVADYKDPGDIAALGSDTHDTADLTLGEVYYLSGVDISSTVSFRADIYTYINGVQSTDPVVTFFANPGEMRQWSPPHRDFVTITGTAGTDAFRVIVKNTDPADAASIYSTIYYSK